ncbi:hypothetical protein CNMCM8927_006240 [Aspergillus lentulus]|uniref:Ketoreductase domain-containing protein n=2 Tax=Aspergillus lentulus TaxID=293939 RepID=A0AAN5YRU2_ASPLE|nr:hypothetical protein CNMCM6069_001393 [Aspergillus lentulus]KAF4174524.1 hypothetical protein CNMCM8060_008572 [Aspergillus lentulus]KAF4193467.1 hypothetical protein CNMCM8694_008812 [Aspergillus lentulus]KAF4205370.1 hypothetical protein CNMCM8927_006240 [Aspergillus lentulus]
MELFSGLRRLLSRRTRTGSRGLLTEKEKVFEGQPQDAEKLYRRDFLEDYSDTETAQFSFFTTKLDSVIQASSINSLALIYGPLHALLDSGEHDGIWWLDVTDPSDGDIELLSRLFDIHPLTTEDIKIRETREKIELFGPYYFLSLRPPQQAEDAPGSRTSRCNVYAIIFREGVLSFTFGNSPHTSHVRNRIKDHQSHLFLTSDWISYALIDDIVDGFAPLIHRVEASVETMEDSVSITRPDDIGLALKQIYTSRRQVLQIRQLLNDKTDVIRCFARHCEALGSTSEVVSYLSDIQDHVLTMVSNLAHSEQRLSRSQDKYLSQLSFDSTRMRNQIVATLSRLTVIASCIVPMQIITGLFGMNVTVPGKNSEGLVKSNCNMDFISTHHHDTYPFIAQSTHHNHKVLITGASRGIGLATAHSFARAGASSIAIAARGPLDAVESALLSTAKEAGHPPPTILKLALDVADEANVAAAAAEVASKFGHLDILINNAGTSERWVPIAESDPADWWGCWEVNVKGVYLVMREFIPLLRKGTEKTIVNVSSIGALLVRPGASAYQTGKFALLRLTEFVMTEYGGEGMLAYAIHPGGVPTELAMGIKALQGFLTDTAELAGDAMSWLTQERREWLGGRYVSVTWDMEELLQKREEIVREDKLKMRLTV